MARRARFGFAKDRSGSIAIIAALSVTVVIGCAAFAIDTGSVYLKAAGCKGRRPGGHRRRAGT